MKESQTEDYWVKESIEQLECILRKQNEKKKASGTRTSDEEEADTSPSRMEMDKGTFAAVMERNPWFALTPERLPIPRKDAAEMHYTEFKRSIFAYIFGSFGFEKDLAKAEQCCHLGIYKLSGRMPLYPFTADERWIEWLREYGEFNILLGTVYAYMGKTTRSVYYFMKAFNTEALSLGAPYSNFIRHMTSKLDDEPCSDAGYTGRGFCAEEPMGFLPSKDAFLYARAALEIIPSLVGLDGELIAAKKSSTGIPYGSMRRYSVSDKQQPHIIDVYEAYVIDRNFNLKKASFYFNGYMPRSDRSSILLPNGFSVQSNSPLRDIYNFM